MKLVESQFDKNDDSVQALTAKNQVLEKSIDAQKNKIETLRSALQNASSSFGETDKRTQAWQVQLNNAEAELNKMERELQEKTLGHRKWKQKQEGGYKMPKITVIPPTINPLTKLPGFNRPRRTINFIRGSGRLLHKIY